MTWTRTRPTPVNVSVYHVNVLDENDAWTTALRLQIGFAQVDLSEADAASLAEYLTSK